MMEESRVMKSPWHLWAVGAVALLWNVAGAYSILLAQSGRLPNPEPDELAYYAAQPLWLAVVTDMALGAAIAGALGLLFRKRAAVWLYALSLGAIVIANSYELAAETSRMLVNRTALIATVVIVAIAIAERVCLDDEAPGRAAVV
jgi:hypothetical protein